MCCGMLQQLHLLVFLSVYRSLAAGSKAGFKLFPLNNVDKLDAIYENGKFQIGLSLSPMTGKNGNNDDIIGLQYIGLICCQLIIIFLLLLYLNSNLGDLSSSWTGYFVL
jgi:hypothetical protein